MSKPLLSVQGLSVSFSQYGRGFQKRRMSAIRDLSLTVGAGELVAVIGASGSGKSLLAHAILGILPYNAVVGGTMEYKGKALAPPLQQRLRGREIVLVPQSVSYLDPLMRVGKQVGKGRRDAASRQKAASTLARYGLGGEVARHYPFELSGGMARRVLISTAVMESPGLVIADEPTPGLHMDIARRVLGHFREIADDGAGVLLITHDLELALGVADRIAVFYAGTTVEEAPAADFANEATLRHPYTKALFRAMPQNGFEATAGTQPATPDTGCAFAARCPHAGEICSGDIPYVLTNGGYVRCTLYGGEGKQ